MHSLQSKPLPVAHGESDAGGGGKQPAWAPTITPAPLSPYTGALHTHPGGHNSSNLQLEAFFQNNPLVPFLVALLTKYNESCVQAKSL